MEIAEITLEVLTPMFSYGERNNRKLLAEFRITELKALMRNTFRELYDFKDLKDMKEKEAVLFGDDERKSPIRFKAKCVKAESHEMQYMLPHKDRDRDRAKMSCLERCRKISFFMMAEDSLSLEFYIKLLLQTAIIGSLGRRSRKGFGSFKITDIKDTKNNRFDKFISLIKSNPIEILKNEQSSINKMRKVENENVGELQSDISFVDLGNDLNYPYAKKIILLKLSETQVYLDLLKNISRLTHERLDYEEDRINGNILGNCRYKGDKLKRYSSPIYVSFSENGNNIYMVIKELNYNYVLKKLNIIESDDKIANKDYINNYVNQLIKIGKGEIK